MRFWCLLFYVALTPMVWGQSVDKAAGKVAGAVDELTMHLFLEQAHEAYTEGDYATARQRYEWLAQRESTEAQVALATLYEEGKGVDRDYEKAYQLFDNAARKGDAEAQLRLARMYFFGRYVSQDNFLAYVWLHISAERGEPRAASNRARLAGIMTRDEILEAEAIAADWLRQLRSPAARISTLQ